MNIDSGDVISQMIGNKADKNVVEKLYTLKANKEDTDNMLDLITTIN